MERIAFTQTGQEELANHTVIQKKKKREYLPVTLDPKDTLSFLTFFDSSLLDEEDEDDDDDFLSLLRLPCMKVRTTKIATAFKEVYS